MGTVSNVSAGSKVTTTDFNTLQTEAAALLAAPSGTYVDNATSGDVQGYDGTISSSQVSFTDSIEAAQWNSLIDDLTLVHKHRKGVATLLSPELPDILTETAPDGRITADRYNDLVDIHNQNYNDRFSVHITNVSVDTATTGTLAANWNGNNQHVFNMTFASENDKFVFFNSGGSLRITASATYTGSELKSIDWKDLVENIEQVDIYANKTEYTAPDIYSGGTKLISYQGWYFLDSKPDGTPDTEVYKFLSSKDGGTPEYNENYVRYRFRRNSNTSYSFFLDFYDIDTGDQTGTGAPVDENVQTVINTTVSVIYPTNASFITATRPTFSANGSTVGFTATYP